jgi:hypothetical protein
VVWLRKVIDVIQLTDENHDYETLEKQKPPLSQRRLLSLAKAINALTRNECNIIHPFFSYRFCKVLNFSGDFPIRLDLDIVATGDFVTVHKTYESHF